MCARGRLFLVRGTQEAAFLMKQPWDCLMYPRTKIWVTLQLFDEQLLYWSCWVSKALHRSTIKNLFDNSPNSYGVGMLRPKITKKSYHPPCFRIAKSCLGQEKGCTNFSCGGAEQRRRTFCIKIWPKILLPPLHVKWNGIFCKSLA